MPQRQQGRRIAGSVPKSSFAGAHRGQLRRDLPHDAEAIGTAKVGRAIKIALGVEYHIADGKAAIVAAGEVVQVGKVPTAVRRRQFENKALVIGAAGRVRAVDISGCIESRAAKRPVKSIKGVKQVVNPAAV